MATFCVQRLDKNVARSGINFVSVGSWWSSPSKVSLGGSVVTCCRYVLRRLSVSCNVKNELPNLYSLYRRIKITLYVKHN